MDWYGKVLVDNAHYARRRDQKECQASEQSVHSTGARSYYTIRNDLSRTKSKICSTIDSLVKCRRVFGLIGSQMALFSSCFLHNSIKESLFQTQATTLWTRSLNKHYLLPRSKNHAKVDFTGTFMVDFTNKDEGRRDRK